MVKHSCIIFVLFAILISANAEDPELKPLFNGTDFTNWQEPDDNVWWTIEKGVLTGKSDPERRGSTLWTSKAYTDFILRLDFRFDSEDYDSGVFIRKEAEQIQIGISRSLQRDMTGSPYISGKGYPVEGVGVSAVLKQDDWNTMVIRAVGNVYTVTLNGQQVLEYASLTAADQGPLGLQIHPNLDMQIAFRNILIAELSS